MTAVRSIVALVALIALLCTPVNAIKFQLQAQKHPEPLCIWNYALQDTLAIISINVVPTDPGKATQQKVAARVIDRTYHNVYLNKPNLLGETRLAISTHHNSDLGVCVTNTGPESLSAIVDLDVQLGGDAVDYNAIANQESLSGMETELRKLLTVADEILEQMDYMKRREMRMTKTNDSTLGRVHSFAWISVVAIVALGVWQVFHLRDFFKRKYLID
ncbi:vesicle coat component [Malassezia cuniculi]|uniref:Vesicle coat component n=1 Tax=Malassezia cuniculi TaxID=948313 RepID=A0AAF0EXQ7_9BASI|nr:vesicle coat component [Malassezia cuniculi]